MEKSWNKIYSGKPQAYTYYSLLEPHHEMPRFAKLLKKEGARRVLDLGCGSGRNLYYLVDRGFEVSGIDFAPKGVALIKSELKKRKKHADVRFGSFYKRLPYPDHQFDAVVCVQSLQHGTARMIAEAVKEIRRVLKPGGLIFITLAGRTSKGKVRFCLVKTAKRIAPNTYVPTQGEEKGLMHFIYNKDLIRKHFAAFKIQKIWRDEKDYYCVLARSKDR